jgi:hypothetical protein
MIEPVADREGHLRAFRRIDELWNAEPGSPEERELEVLATLVDSYERERFPILPLEIVGDEPRGRPARGRCRDR